ncbi:hypothetical protein ACRALDRAFT_213353 [Sodiomyces alcalophilus JCM 7366]|uniref:uncharacterized protein n=1 Tax=Sodiomyces alcalophilus JCM 7366 TaxID=591952 RepID=UPI0039B505A9
MDSFDIEAENTLQSYSRSLETFGAVGRQVVVQRGKDLHILRGHCIHKDQGPKSETPRTSGPIGSNQSVCSLYSPLLTFIIKGTWSIILCEAACSEPEYVVHLRLLGIPENSHRHGTQKRVYWPYDSINSLQRLGPWPVRKTPCPNEKDMSERKRQVGGVWIC